MEYEELLSSAFEKINKVDKCERFEIKKVNVIQEGNNKTWITNFVQLSIYLRRDQEHFAKFLYKNLAAYGEIVGERLLLGRKISPEMIQRKVELYVNQYVCCPECKKPDTELVEENGRLYLKCLACGVKKEVHN